MSFNPLQGKGRAAIAGAALFATTLSFSPLTTPAKAADHAESTSVAGDPPADLADAFAFVDPKDSTKVVLAMTFEGFIVPSELSNIGFFAPDVLYRFSIENTGDAKPDASIDVTFTEQTSRSAPQTAKIRLPNGTVITAPTTVQTLNDAPNPFLVTTDTATGTSFFAGLTDDPFFFDIVGFNRFVGSVLAGNPVVSHLNRGRDSFAGYNIHTIAISIPAAALKGVGNTIGVNAVTLRKQNLVRADKDENLGSTVIIAAAPGDIQFGSWVQIDRMATPAVNTVLIPFARKNEYNASSPEDDAAGRFAGDIVATLKAVGTNNDFIGILASVAVAKGDYLRLDMSKPNIGNGGGDNAGIGFPNGRRLGDDVIDTILGLVANGAALGDNVPKNDVPLSNTFPYFAPPQQPRGQAVIDDNTRN